MPAAFRQWLGACLSVVALDGVAMAADTDWKPFSQAVAVCRVDEPSGLILGQLKLGNHAFSCVVDTGSSVTLIDSALAPGLGEPVGSVKVDQASGGGTVSAYRAESLEVLGVKNHGLSHLFAFDLSTIRDSLDIELRAIVGMDFLKKYCLCIDYHAGVISVCEPSQVRFDQLQNGFKLNVDGTGRPVLPAWIGNHFREDMLIDTGYVGTATLSTNSFNRAVSLGLVRRLQNDQSKVGADGVKWVPAGRLNQVNFKDWTIEDLVVTANEPSTLGLYFLRRFRVVLDFPESRAFLEESPAFEDTDRDDWDGLRVFNDLGYVKVDAVEPNSHAHRAGFLVDDVLLRIGDKPVKDLGVHGVRRTLALDKRESIDFVVLRKGTLLTVKHSRSQTPPSQVPTEVGSKYGPAPAVR